MTDTFEGKEESALRVYEVGYLVLPSVPEEHIPEIVDRAKSFIAKGNGAIISDENPKLRPLAYEMVKHVGTRNEHFKTAYFGWIKFETTPEGVLEVKKAFDAMGEILRFILIKTTREIPVLPQEILEEAEALESIDEAVPTLSPQAEIDKSIDELVIE